MKIFERLRAKLHALTKPSGFFAGLTPEQQQKALEHTGDDGPIGDPYLTPAPPAPTPPDIKKWVDWANKESHPERHFPWDTERFG